MARRRWPGSWGLGWSDLWALVPVLVLTWPMWTRGGHALARDLVFTPRMPWTPEAVGMGSGPARAVPLDAALATLTSVVDGAVVYRVAIAGALLLAALGAARVVPDLSAGARVLAGGFAVWNPYVVERLALGQWALLWGYAALFWLVPAWRRVLSGERGAALRTWPLMGLGALVPTGGVLVALVAACSVLASAARRATTRSRGLLVLGLAVLAQLPWLVPSLIGGHDVTSSADGVTAFAARPERAGGVWPTLVAGGGIWSRYVVPGSLGTPFGHLLTLVCVVLLVVAARTLWRLRPELWVAGVLSLLLAGLAHLPGGEALMTWLVTDVPGGGLLRDGHKWLAPWIVLLVAAAGVAWDRLQRRVAAAEPGLVPAAGVVAALVPLVLVPDAAGRTWQALTPVHYPAGLAEAVEVLDRAAPSTGAVATLPWSSYRRFGWGNDLSAPDPLPRWTDHDVIVSDVLMTEDGPLAGEDPRAQAVERALRQDRSAAALAEAGVGWVLVYRGAEGGESDIDQGQVLGQLEPVLDDPAVVLLRNPEPVRAGSGWTTEARLVAWADVLWLVSLLVAGLLGVMGRGLGRRRLVEPGVTETRGPA